MTCLSQRAELANGYRDAMHDDVATGPIITATRTESSETAKPVDSFNLVACALGSGAITLTLSTIGVYASFALTLAVIALVLAGLGVATSRRHSWAAWIGALASGVAVLLGVVSLTS